MNKILIYGAGALGRGFLAPILFNLGYEIYFVDKNPVIINLLKRRKNYRTAVAVNKRYIFHDVDYTGAYFFGEEDKILKKMDLVITAAGQKNIASIACKLKDIPVVISFENDINSVDELRKFSENCNCYFGIPDVIVSNTAPHDLLTMDPLCVVSEEGQIIIEEGNYFTPKDIKQAKKKEIDEWWTCKLLLHNTPHAAIAYLGWLQNFKYIHEAIRVAKIKEIVDKIVNSLKVSIATKKMVDIRMAEFYAQRELKRFGNELLYDPIERVAREPLRKLRPHDRLIRPLRLLQETGMDILPLCTVINALFEYENPRNDNGIGQLMKKIGKDGILKEICKISPEEEIFSIILNNSKLTKEI